MNELTLTPPVERVVRRRTRRDPKPRFKGSRANQLDAVLGCPNEQVPVGHLSRQVRAQIAELDLRAFESKYSSLGRHGFEPRALLALWVYASLTGVHHASKLARLLETDAACRLLSGGHVVSRSKLSEFRQQAGELFAAAIEQTVRAAVDAGLVKPEELAVDSARIRAHGSTNAVRTVTRSTKRLKELTEMDATKLSEAEQAKRSAKLEKHRAALAECEARGRTSLVTTNPSAALMKFPSGASAPGHRLTVTAAGVRERLIVAVLIDDAAVDYGKLEDMLVRTRAALTKAGLSAEASLQVAADAGYASRDDLLAAERARADHIDVLVNGAERPTTTSGAGMFGHDDFVRQPDGGVKCPSGARMLGPHANADGRLAFRGVGCPQCPLRAQCTTAKYRGLTIDPQIEHARAFMTERMGRPGAKERYGQRIATVEPVFAHLEDTMGFRRASSRHAVSVIAEILLKVLAHNVRRLMARRPLRLAYLTVDQFLATL